MADIYIVAGGDKRYVSLAIQLASEHKVYAAGFEEEYFAGTGVICVSVISEIKEKADVLILPMPVSDDGIALRTPLFKGRVMLTELICCLDKYSTVFGGAVSQTVEKLFSSFGYQIIDYFKREELAVQNAEATAEGAVGIAISELPEMLSGMKVLIFGMGRIAKLLISRLSAFGADITVAARRYSSLAWAGSMGCKAVLISELDSSDIISSAGLIINTVPALVIGGRRLAECRKDCLIIDLASKPGGVDLDTAQELGIKTIWALGLPGKTAPVSAGRIIKNTIENILHEMDEPI